MRFHGLGMILIMIRFTLSPIERARVHRLAEVADQLRLSYSEITRRSAMRRRNQAVKPPQGMTTANGFAISLAVEEHSVGRFFRHLYLASPNVGQSPKPVDVIHAMAETGFESDLRDLFEKDFVWFEELPSRAFAVHVIEPLDGNLFGVRFVDGVFEELEHV